MTMYVAIYCIVSALCQFLLGFAWRYDDELHRGIKFIFLFLCTWGFFFGAYLIRGLL